MAFTGRTFSFDSVPSEVYNLFVSNTSGGDVQINNGANVEISTENIYQRPMPYTYGVSQTGVLTFPLTVMSPDEITADESGKISRWLFGQLGYKKLQIFQADLTMVYFNCILTSPRTRRIGNKIVGYDFTVVCDSPWAWEFPRSIDRSYTEEVVFDTLQFDNLSESSDYMRPTLTMTINSFGGDFTITNDTDAGNDLTMAGLSPNEVITIDNDRMFLTSSSGLRRFSNFNGNWLRLAHGRNNLSLTGNVSRAIMTYQSVRRVT